MIFSREFNLHSIFFFLLSISFFSVIAQEKVITLNQTVTGTKDYVARDEVRMLPGFSYNASENETFTARVDNTLICNVDYIPANRLPDPDNRQLDYSLPVGSIPGSGGVSPAGAATYQIPLFVPQGTAGMQPNIAIGCLASSSKKTLLKLQYVRYVATII